MTSADISVKKLMQEFRLGLSGLYPEKEIMQFVYILAEEILSWPKTALHLDPERMVPAVAVNLLSRALEELKEGRPIQYVTGTCWFNGTRLKVGPGVLIPRPETEELCLLVKKELPAASGRELTILDIGTGSGCIAIDLKKHLPEAGVTAIDNSTVALGYAMANAATNRCTVTFVRANILDRPDREKLGTFNIIVSNPPYVTQSEMKRMQRNVTAFEPQEALFVPDDDPLIYYRAICGFGASHLAGSGILCMEINERFGKEVGELAGSSGFANVTLFKDLHGKDRFIKASLRQRMAGEV